MFATTLKSIFPTRIGVHLCVGSNNDIIDEARQPMDTANVGVELH